MESWALPLSLVSLLIDPLSPLCDLPRARPILKDVRPTFLIYCSSEGCSSSSSSSSWSSFILWMILGREFSLTTYLAACYTSLSKGMAWCQSSQRMRPKLYVSIYVVLACTSLRVLSASGADHTLVIL